MEDAENGAKPVSFIDEIVASQAAEQVIDSPLSSEKGTIQILFLPESQDQISYILDVPYSTQLCNTRLVEHLDNGGKPVSFIDKIVASQAAEQVIISTYRTGYESPIADRKGGNYKGFQMFCLKSRTRI